MFSTCTPLGPGAYLEVAAHPMAKNHSAGPWHHRGRPDRMDYERAEVFLKDLPETFKSATYGRWPCPATRTMMENHEEQTCALIVKIRSKKISLSKDGGCT